MLKTLFTAPPDAVYAGEANASVFGPLTGAGSVFTMDESPHLDRRRLLLPQFHGDRMQVYFEQIHDIAAEAVSSWRPGVAFALHPQTQQMTLQAIIRSKIGRNPLRKWSPVRAQSTSVHVREASPVGRPSQLTKSLAGIRPRSVHGRSEPSRW